MVAPDTSRSACPCSYELCTDGNPAMAYLDLWSRNWDENIISPVDYEEFAYGSGYIGTRGVRSWKERIHRLVDLGFIKITPRGNREIGHILIVNPLLVCAELKAAGKSFPDNWWPTFFQRVQEIGAKIPSPPPRDENPF